MQTMHLENQLDTNINEIEKPYGMHAMRFVY